MSIVKFGSVLLHVKLHAHNHVSPFQNYWKEQCNLIKEIWVAQHYNIVQNNEGIWLVGEALHHVKELMAWEHVLHKFDMHLEV